MIRLIQRHRRTAAALHRVSPIRAIMARRVWRELERTPGFNERMARAKAQLEAGQGVLYEPGQCLRHGHVLERCCALWEPRPRTTFLKDAIERPNPRDNS